MGSSSCEQECLFCIVLLPNQEPIRFKVTFPAFAILSRKFVRVVIHRKLTVGFSKRMAVLSSSMSYPRLRHRSVSLRNVLVILISYMGAQIPNDLNISSDEENFSTRPACLSS